MGYRFRKRVKILPGVYLNASAHGLSMSVGPRGASLNFSSRGTYANTKVPGLPLYQRQRVDGGRAPRRGSTAAPVLDGLEHLARNNLMARIDGDDGSVILMTQDGQEISAEAEATTWKYAGDTLRRHIGQAVEGLQKQHEALETLHQSMPPPSPAPVYVTAAFDEDSPTPPVRRKYHWFWKLFAFHRRSVDSVNADIDARYAESLRAWEQRRSEFAREQAAIKALYDRRARGNQEDLETFLEWHLKQLQWPRETLVSFELAGDCRSLSLDIDLPEIEDMPTKYPETTSSGRKVKWKVLSDIARRKLYMQHVHGIALRLVGEVFAQLQGVSTVTVSGYSQRRSAATAAIEDEYLYSARIERGAWSQIDFTHLDHLDPVDAFERFELRRKMTVTGIFKPIEPLSVDSPA